MSRWRATVVATVLFGTALGVGVTMFFYHISNPETSIGWVELFTAAMAAAGALVAIVTYLNRPSLQEGPPRSDEYNETAFISQVDDLRRFLERSVVNLRSDTRDILAEFLKTKTTMQNADISSDERSLMVNDIVKKINDTLSEEFVKAIDAKYASSIVRSTEANGLISDFELLKRRLNQAIAYLERRSNVNLTIGIATTLGAVAGLYYAVFQSGPVDIKDMSSILGHYIPRLSFVVFVEVFSYFFLKLYKSNLEDVKFYHNELTSIDAKLIALRSSLLVGDDSLLKSITTTLSKVERNYVLKKGETTVEIEKTKLDGKGASDSLKQILGIFKTIKEKT